MTPSNAQPLAHYATRRIVNPDARGPDPVWHQLLEWQRAGLLSIRPLNRRTASVELTDKGRAACLTT